VNPCFASDNWAPAHPDVLAAIFTANHGPAAAYGGDPWTVRAQAALRTAFGAPDAVVIPVFNGTGANLVALDCLLLRHQAVICPASAHINRDECGGPERFLGAKLLSVPTADGKLRPADIHGVMDDSRDGHRVEPRVVSISQVTELGTVYDPAEIRALADAAHGHGLLLHIDGARLANAAAALEVPLAEFTTAAGVDVVGFGATKNGAITGEAVVFLSVELGARAEAARRQAMQLASKMRFVAVQIEALLHADLWLENARTANAMAQRLADAVGDAVEIVYPVESNAVFAAIPADAAAGLQEAFDFGIWNTSTGVVRWMTSWTTTPAEVDAFAAAILAAVA
jgi:threonine aldolase